MKDLRKQTHKKMAHGSGHPIATCFGILGWLFHGILSVITAGLIIMAIVGLLIYAKVKPELDQCREIAYDKLAQMERSDFSIPLSMTRPESRSDLLTQVIISM